MNTKFALFFCFILCTFYAIWMFSYKITKKYKFLYPKDVSREKVDLWVIFTKAASNGHLVNNFRILFESLCAHTSAHLNFNLISDNSSLTIAKHILETKSFNNYCSYNVTFYNKGSSIEQIQDIVDIMTPHFSSHPGAYYSDPFYYISLGLHRIAPQVQKKVILIDCDLVFEDDIHLLFEEFNKFSVDNLFGVAHELSSVYHHTLRKYKMENNETQLGEPVKCVHLTNSSSRKETCETKGFPGFNSGVVLLNLEKIKNSLQYKKLLTNETVSYLTKKYSFKGSLGDQDFFTLLYFEFPEIFYILHCGWNRQLCKWWKKTEENSDFEEYFKCNPPIHVFHKNCHTSL